MTNIDNQRIAAVRVLDALGSTFLAGEWKAPDGNAASLIPSADAIHGLLMRRADELAGCSAPPTSAVFNRFK